MSPRRVTRRHRGLHVTVTVDSEGCHVTPVLAEASRDPGADQCERWERRLLRGGGTQVRVSLCYGGALSRPGGNISPSNFSLGIKVRKLMNISCMQWFYFSGEESVVLYDREMTLKKQNNQYDIFSNSD